MHAGEFREGNKEVVQAACELDVINIRRRYRVDYFEEIGEGKPLPPPTDENAPVLELKPLPSHLRYAYIGENETLPVIVSASLSNSQLEKLLRVLRERNRAIGWTILDLRGVSPTLCMHRILMEENYKPVVENQ